MRIRVRCPQIGTKLKKMLAAGTRKRHSLSLQGIALLTKLAADKEVSGIPRARRYTVGIFRRDTGELLSRG